MTESEVKQNEQEEVKNDIEVLCPSCGRFVGAYEICPHCQTQVNTRVSIKLVKRIAVIGAIVGIILLYFAAKNREVPMINIGEIQINHNMALVKVSGRVIRESIQDKKDNFSLTIDDGTGKIKLGGYNKLKKWKKHFGEKFPKEGDFIEVTGNLNITEQFGASMFLSSPHRLVVKKSFNPKRVKLNDLRIEDVNSTYRVTVKIDYVKKFGMGYSIRVTDNSVSDQSAPISLTIFDTAFNRIKNENVKKAITTKGSVCEFVAILGEYKGTLQLKLKSPDNPNYFKVIEMGAGDPYVASTTYKNTYSTTYVNKSNQKATPEQIKNLSKDDVKKYVEITGIIDEVTPQEWGTRVILTQDGSSIMVWIKKFIVGKMKLNLAKGQKLKVLGNINDFKGTLQVVPISETGIQEVTE